jgi:hypothetical protein
VCKLPKPLLVTDTACPVATNRSARSLALASKVRSLSDNRLAVVIVLLLFGVYLATMGGHTYSIDDETYLAGAKALVHHRTVIQPNPDIASTIALVRHKNGLGTTAAPIGTLLLFAPGVVLGKVFSLWFAGPSREEASRLVYLASNSAITAITAGLLLLLCRRLGASRRAAVLLAVSFGLGSFAWPHSKTGFSEPGTGLMLTAALLILVKHWQKPTRWTPFWVGALAGCVGLTRSTALLFVPVFAAMVVVGSGGLGYRARVRSLALFCIGGIPPAFAFCANSWFRFGSLLDNGYPALGFTTPLPEGIFGLFLSPGKGLLWFAPICITALFAFRLSFNAQRRYAVTVGLIVVAHIAVYARFAVWSGEAAFGPRYMLPLLPMLIATLAPVIDSARHWWRGAMLTTLVGLAGPGLVGGSMYFNAVYSRNIPDIAKYLKEETPDNDEMFRAWQFIPQTSQSALYAKSLPKLVRSVSNRLNGVPSPICELPTEYQTRIFWYNNSIEPDYWWAWWHLRKDDRRGFVLLIAPIVSWFGALMVGRAGALSPNENGSRRSRPTPRRRGFATRRSV